MALEDLKPEMVVIHLYEGKVIDVWVAYQADNPHNYVLGRSQLEAREQFAAQPIIEIVPAGEGFQATCQKFKDLVGWGLTKKAAEKVLIRQINLLDGKVDWREMFFEYYLSHSASVDSMPWDEKEKTFVRKELARRATAAQFSREEVTRRMDQAAQERVFDAEAPFGEQ